MKENIKAAFALIIGYLSAILTGAEPAYIIWYVSGVAIGLGILYLSEKRNK